MDFASRTPRPAGLKTGGAFFVFLALVSCTPPAAVSPAPRTADFEEVALPFTHSSGAEGNFFLPEIMGSGAALLDYDADGDLDIFLIQGSPSAGSNQLLRNDHGRFTDATGSAGLEARNYGMGAATADFDNDGYVDLLVTAFGGNKLYRNTGKGTFADVTSRSPAVALAGRWSTSASFFDYDNDGWPDLVILNYVDYQFTANKRCTSPAGETDYCTPRAYRSLHSHLFHNEHGRFVDVTSKAGLDRANGPGLGVVAFDANADGYLDIFVANDSSANHLWINQKNGTFTEEALQRGVAYAENGLARAGMGVSLGDYDNDGDEDLIVLNLMREGATLFRNDGDGNFTDVSAANGIHALTFQFTGFGVGWLDADRDGRLDLFLANGAVTRRDEQRGSPQPFRERNLLLRQGATRFEVASIPALDKPAVYRGAAFGDIDNDGDVDIVVTANSGNAILLRNNSSAKNWLAVEAPLGSRVELKSPGLPPQTRYVRTDSSYLSASDPTVLFTAGARIESLTVRSPGKPRRSFDGVQIPVNKRFKVP